MTSSAALAHTVAPRSRLLEGLPETTARVVIGGLFMALAWRLGGDFLKTGRPTDLLLLVGESLVVILTCLRRPAVAIDHRTAARLVTAASMVSPLMVRPVQQGGVIPDTAAASLAVFGLLLVIAGKMSLGYSFGLLPANRGVIERGLYRVIRHPIYLGYLLTHAPFLAAHPSAWNLSVMILGDAALIVRASYEEETLSQDPQYRRYCEVVRWRLIPRVY